MSNNSPLTSTSRNAPLHDGRHPPPTVSVASQPGSSSSTLKVLQPSDFSRRRGDPVGGRVNQSTPLSGHSPLVDARTVSNESSNDSADHGSNDSTADSTSSSVPTTVSNDSRFSDRRLSAWDIHLRAMTAPTEQAARASLTGEEQVLLDRMQKHFSSRPDLNDWDASLKSMLANQDQADLQSDGAPASDPRFSVRSMGGWDRQLPLNALAQEVLNRRFSVRPDSDWDASLSQNDSKASRSGLDDAAIKAHFSVRQPQDWDAGVLASYAQRLSSRELEDWDAQVFKKLLASRFSTRSDEEWDARVRFSSVSPPKANQNSVRRSRSSTVFSDRRLSAWDAGLVQKIPDISRKGAQDEESSYEQSHDSGRSADSAIRRAKSGSLFSCRNWNEWDASLGIANGDTDAKREVIAHNDARSSHWLKAPYGKPQHNSIFSIREADCWDAGLSAQLRDAIETMKTPTVEDNTKQLGGMNAGDGLGLYGVGA